MNWEATAAFGEILSAIAVLVTLVYLSIQVRHARNTQQSEAIRANRQERREFFSQTRDSRIPGIIAKLETDTEISREDELRLMYHNSAHWGLLYSEWVQNRLNSLGDYGTSLEARIRFAFSQQGSIEWFESFAASVYTEEFVEDVLLELEKFREEQGYST